MDAMESIIKNLDWSPLFISLKTGIVATFISFFLGIYAARKVVKTTPGKKAVIDGILTLPMVLPPTVAGFFLLLIFSKRRPFGIFLYETFDIKVVQSWLGCIIAATVIAFPLMYRNARAAFEQLDVNLIYAGRTLGMSDIACGSKSDSKDDKKEETKTEAKADDAEDVELQVFIAASLSKVMDEVATEYQKDHPNVKITFNADSSGTLLTQIEEGYACDVFFSAAQKQMDQLEKTDGLVVDGTRKNVVNNQVVVVTRKDSGTKVTGLETLKDASSIALAGGSVPVGKYTRQALVNLGILDKVDDVSTIPTETVSEALGGVEISEQDNVSKVLAAVVEGSCEVGTTYYSDTYGYEDELNILQTVSYDLTGNVIYPIAQVKNDEASDAEVSEAKDFIDFVTSDKAKTIFQKYYFDTDVE